MLIDQSRSYGSRNRRLASEAVKLFRLPPTYLGSPSIRLLLQTGDCLHFTEFFDRYFHIPLPIVTKHELGLPFPLRNLPIKFGTNPSTIFFSYRSHRQTHTDTQAHKPTPVKHNPTLSRGELSIRRWRCGPASKFLDHLFSVCCRTIGRQREVDIGNCYISQLFSSRRSMIDSQLLLHSAAAAPL